MIEEWFKDLLKRKNKDDIQELTHNEISEEIDEIRETIKNEMIWGNFENIACLRLYLKELEAINE